MFREPNPMDPFDDVKRWYAGLWPVQRWGVWMAAAVIAWAAFKWITR